MSECPLLATKGICKSFGKHEVCCTAWILIFARVKCTL